MNGITFIRKIDDLGRIVIPKELRGKLKLSENENILLKPDTGLIFLMSGFRLSVEKINPT